MPLTLKYLLVSIDELDFLPFLSSTVVLDVLRVHTGVSPSFPPATSCAFSSLVPVSAFDLGLSIWNRGGKEGFNGQVVGWAIHLCAGMVHPAREKEKEGGGGEIFSVFFGTLKAGSLKASAGVKCTIAKLIPEFDFLFFLNDLPCTIKTLCYSKLSAAYQRLY